MLRKGLKEIRVRFIDIDLKTLGLNTLLINKFLGFKAQNGYLKNDAGHVNKANKKGQFGSVGQFSKGAKNDGTAFGKNQYATKFAKGTKFGAKGAHKKGHATKGFHNTHHKVGLTSYLHSFKLLPN